MQALGAFAERAGARLSTAQGSGEEGNKGGKSSHQSLMSLKTLQSMQPDRAWVGAVKTFKCTKRFRIVSESCAVGHTVMR